MYTTISAWALAHHKNFVPQHTAKGFTLIECLITVALLGLMLGVGVPSFEQFIKKQSGRASATDIYRSYQLARSEAVNRGERITWCGSDNGHSCQRHWQQSILIFLDRNNNQKMEPPERIQHIRLTTRNRFFTRVALGRPYMHLNANGSNAQNGSVVVCAPEPIHQVIFNRAGRPYYAGVTKREDRFVSPTGKTVTCR